MIFLQERYWGLPILSRNPHPNCSRASKRKPSFGPPCIAHLIIQNFSTNIQSNYLLSSSDELCHLLRELLFFLFQANVLLWIPFFAQQLHMCADKAQVGGILQLSYFCHRLQCCQLRRNLPQHRHCLLVECQLPHTQCAGFVSNVVQAVAKLAHWARGVKSLLQGPVLKP